MQSITKHQTSALTLVAIPAFTDNYIWCLHNGVDAMVVDPGDGDAVADFLKQQQLRLCAVLITHHHLDHVGGLPTLHGMYPNMPVYGPNNPKIKYISHPLENGSTIKIDALDLRYKVLATPGHTLDHIVYYDNTHLFCGDTLFSAGCGRMFEGTAPMFYQSLQALSALPAHLQVCCTHEYTAANVAFAQSIEPHNEALHGYQQWVVEQRTNNKITLPSTIAQQHEINPFLRCHIKSVQQAVLDPYTNACSNNTETEVATFAALRKRKDDF
ncbi:MAG: hydroxyacylglutathione hydrolase [Glaciecola sp.]